MLLLTLANVRTFCFAAARTLQGQLAVCENPRSPEAAARPVSSMRPPKYACLTTDINVTNGIGITSGIRTLA